MKLKRIATRLTVALLISAMFMLNVSAGLVYAADDASAESTAISVSDVFDCATGEEVVVEGVFVGVSFADTSDAGVEKEVLIKDENTNDVIAVRKVPYGTFPDVGYTKGDKIRFSATVTADTKTNNKGRKHLEFSADNGEIASTIVSSGNSIDFDLSEATAVTDWNEMKALFTNGIEPYTLIKVTGTTYMQYYSNIKTYRPHMNTSAKAVAGIRVDASRTLGLYNGAMEANLGSDWLSYFGVSPKENVYPGASFTKEYYMLYVAASNSRRCCVILDKSWIPFTNEEIIKEVAYSYQRQTGQILYDQYALRKHAYASPEEATAQHQMYLDCSGYVNACYYEAFGVPVLPNTYPTTTSFYNYVKRNPSASDVPYFWKYGEFDTVEEQDEIEDIIRNELQVGDILGYRHGAQAEGKTEGNLGHVYIYVGDGKFLHRSGSGGGSFKDNEKNPANSYDEFEDDTGISSISTMLVDTLFTTTNTRYLFSTKTADTVYSIFVIRPLARELTPTKESKDRMTIAGLAMEKISSSHFENTSVRTGDVITYTITLENFTYNTINNVILTDTIPAGTEYVSGSGSTGVTVDGNKLTWTGSVQPRPDDKIPYTETITYNVKVTSTTPGQLIESNQTYVNGVKLGNITHSVSTYSQENSTDLTTFALAYKDAGKTFSSSIEMARALYNEALGVNLESYESVGAMLDELIDKRNNTCRTDTELSEMLVPHLFGGMDIRSGHYLIPDNERTRLLSEEELSVGDIIVADWVYIDGQNSANNTSGDILYVYAGNSTLLALKNGKATALPIGDDIYGSDADNILISIYGYDRFAVLRPSMAEAIPTEFVILNGDATVARGETLTLETEGGGAGEVTFEANKDGVVEFNGNILTPIKSGTVTVTAHKGNNTSTPITVKVQNLPSLPDTIVGGNGKIDGLDTEKTYKISPVVMKSATVTGTTLNSSVLLPAIEADSWTELTDNAGLAGLYKIKAFDASSGEDTTEPKFVWVKGKIADREDIGSTSYDGSKFNMISNNYGSSWYVGRFSMGSIASATYASGTTEINIITTGKPFRTRVVTEPEQRYTDERKRYDSIVFDSNSNVTNPATYINNASDKDAAKALYAEAAEHYTLNYAMANREVIPANTFGSMSYKTRHDGSVNMGSTKTKVRFYVYNIANDTLDAYDAYDDVYTSSATGTFSTHEIFASDAKLVTYDPALEGHGQTVAYLDKNIQYSETVTLANVSDGNYIVGFEIHPVADMDTSATAGWSVSGTTVNRFPTRFLKDEYSLNIPAADAPDFDYIPETISVSGLDANANYYMVKLIDGVPTGDKISLTTDENGKVDLIAQGITVGTWGIGTYGNDYEVESEYRAFTVEAPDAPSVTYDPETKTVSVPDANKSYYIVPLEMNDNGKEMKEAAEIEALTVSDGKASISDITEGLWGIGTHYGSDYQITSKYAIIYIPGTDTQKQNITMNNATTTDGYPYKPSLVTDWTPGVWTHYNSGSIGAWKPNSYAIAHNTTAWNVTLSNGNDFNMTTDKTTYATLPTEAPDTATDLQKKVMEASALLSYKYELLPEEIIPAKDFKTFKYAVRLDNSSIIFGKAPDNQGEGGTCYTKLVIYTAQPDGTIKSYDATQTQKRPYYQSGASYTGTEYTYSYDDFASLSDDGGYIVGIEIFPCIANDATEILYRGTSANNSFAIRIYYSDYEFIPTAKAPTVEMAGGDTLTVSDYDDAKYSYEYKAEGGQWKPLTTKSITVDKAGTKYYVRIADGATYNASPASIPVTSHDFVATGTSLVLGGEIGIKTTFDVANQDAFKALKFYDHDTNTEIRAVPDGNAFIVYVPAKDKTRNFEYRYTYGDEPVTRSLETVASYIEYFSSTNEKANALVAALDNYTDYSAVYFEVVGAAATGTPSDVLAGKVLTDEEKASASVKNIEGFEYLGASLILEGKTAIRHYFKAGTEALSFKVEIDGLESESAVCFDLDNECYYVDVTDVAAENYDKLYTVEISFADKTNTIKYSVMNYLVNSVKKTDNEKLVNLVKAMYDYHVATEAYNESQAN